MWGLEHVTLRSTSKALNNYTVLAACTGKSVSQSPHIVAPKHHGCWTGCSWVRCEKSMLLDLHRCANILRVDCFCALQVALSSWRVSNIRPTDPLAKLLTTIHCSGGVTYPTTSHFKNFPETAARVDFLPSRQWRGNPLTQIVTRVPSTGHKFP